jgi:hypothetical protein
MGGDIILPVLGSRGYYVMNLTRPGVRKQVFLHKIILESFIGARPENMQACHNDGNRLNCRLENLRWDTASSNHKDKRLHGTWQVGEKANNVKFTSGIVIAIRTENLSVKESVERFGMSRTHAKRIINKETWKHLDAQ